MSIPSATHRTRFLEKLGARSTVVEHGAAALEAVRRGSIDLILMDCHMPGMDGFEATRRIRSDARWARVPIIALTASATPQDRELCLTAGRDDFLPKPLELGSLRKALERWSTAKGQPREADYRGVRPFDSKQAR